MSSLSLSPIQTLTGRLTVPGDKSISHRCVLLGAAASGTTRVRGLSGGADVQASLACVARLGATWDRQADGTITITGWGHAGPQSPASELDCVNSGTTMRLMAGLLSGYPVTVTLIGDASLSRRPMARVLEPLTRMGAGGATHDGRPPLTISGGALRGIDWTSPVASAQLKSAVMLAALRATGTTRVTEPVPTRDHSERVFPLFGLTAAVSGATVTVPGGQQAVAPAETIAVPGDPSSAATWAAAASAIPGSDITITGVCLNPRRTASLDALRRMGACIDVTHEADLGGEPVGTIRVRHGLRQDTTIGGDEVPGLIDELPVLAASAAHGARLEVHDAEELRVKESDRISALVAGLRALGVHAEEFPDGFLVDGRAGRPSGGTADAAHDHRLVMAFAIVALGASGASTIQGADVVSVSYPDFVVDLHRLSAR